MYRKRFFKKIFALAAIIIIFTALLQIQASAVYLQRDRIAAGSFIVIDFETGMELFAHNADTMRGPASMTKMMSVYLVYEAIENGYISLDTVVPISHGAIEVSRNPMETNVPLTRTGAYTVSELLDAVIVVSAAGATRALAELVGGSRGGFVAMMNDKARQWDIDALFRSASGGTGGPGGTNMTARAMATITRNTIMRFPEVLEKTALQYITFAGRTWQNTNTLLGVYDGIDGFKTGTNASTGAHFTGTAEREDIRIITVAMGTTWRARFTDTSTMLDYGFAAMEEYRFGKSKASPFTLAAIVNGNEFAIGAYYLRGYNYINISDIAYILNDTAAQFNIGFDSAENMLLQLSDDADLTAMEISNIGEERKWATPISARVLLEDDELNIYGYSIDGYSFFRLLDVAFAFGFDIESVYDNETVIISIMEDGSIYNEDYYEFYLINYEAAPNPPIIAEPFDANLDELISYENLLSYSYPVTTNIKLSNIAVFATIILGFGTIKKRKQR